MEERGLVDQQLYAGNLLRSLVGCGRVGPLIVVAQKRQPELRVPSAGRFYVKSPGVVGAKWVTVSASITGKSLLRFVARSYVLGLCRACFICSNPDSDGNYGTACKCLRQTGYRCDSVRERNCLWLIC